MAGQSIMDRVVAAKHSIVGQGLAKSVCKATTEEIIGPKKKHLDYLLQCTHEPNVSIPSMADLLIERTQHTNWVVVFKALVSIHNLMNYGNERFTQYLASNNCSFNLSGFVDKGGVQGYDMSTFIRRYAKYLNEKALSYRLMAFDFCKVKRGKEDGLLRTMNTDKLLKTLPVLQQQLDALLEFDCTPNELTNGVITACFMLLFKDLIRLFACYNDGIINLLEKFFDMNKKQCKEALDLYKKFLVRMDKVSEFLKVAENMGIDKGDIPDLAKGSNEKASSAPASLLDALEQHLASLEGKKGAATTPTSASKPLGFTSALNTMSSNTFNVSEAERKRILEEESLQLQKLKEQKIKEATSTQYSSQPSTSSSANPFTASSSSTPPANTSQTSNFVSASAIQPAAASAGKPSDDLLSLTGNPFAGTVQGALTSTYPQTNSNPFGAATFQPNGFAAPSSSSAFTSDVDFAMAFSNGVTSTQAMPQFSETAAVHMAGAPPGFDAFGDVLQPMNKTSTSPSPSPQTPQQAKVIGKDLDSSLATLASNLNVRGGAVGTKKDHQWQPKGESKLTGGSSFQKQPVAQSTTTAWGGVPPVAQPTPNSWGVQPVAQATATSWGAPPGLQAPAMMGTPMMYSQPYGTPVQAPIMGMNQQMGLGIGMGTQPGVGMPSPAMFGAPRMMGGYQQPGPAQAPGQPNSVSDPFGAL